MTKSVVAILSGILALPLPAVAAERVIPFWPDEVPAAIHAEIDGNAVLETVRELGRFHRVHGSPGYASAAEHMKRKLLAAGLSDASIERFPADGKTRYAHFVSYYGWNPVTATLEEVGPRPSLVESFPELPVVLADYSQDADVTAALVDVGAGDRADSYAGKDIKGKIVLADGSLPDVHRLACEERGAAGFLSDFPNQPSAWSGDDRDLVRWGHLSPYQLANRFAFMISRRQAEQYRIRLAEGEKIVLHARVRAKMVPATYDVVVATIPGSDPAAGEIVLTAHLCHESAGANDNASGSAAIFEVARALRNAIGKRTLTNPRRTIRFLWLPEIAGSQAYLIRHPEIARRLAAGIHMDMVGGLLSTTKGTFHVSRSAESRPHVVNEIARAWLDEVIAASQRYAERGGDPDAGFAWLPGSREPLLADLRALELGSDHEVFEEASFGVPMVYFHDYPDVTIHTNKDQPENLDATKLGRVAYLGAGIAYTLAALPDTETPRLLRDVQAHGEARIALSGGGEDRDDRLSASEAIAVEEETLASVAALWPSTAPMVERERGRLRELASVVRPAAAPGGDPRVPVRNPEIRGPLDVYYFDYLATALGSTPLPPSGGGGVSTALSHRARGDLLAYEALNFVDGKRSVSEIRDVLSGRYEPVPLAEIAEYLDRLARAKVVTWKWIPPFDFSPANLDREFPVRRSLVYFNHAAVAPLPRRVSDAIIAHVENIRDRGAADWRKWYGAIERTRERAARLIGAERTQISFLPSTSWALNLVARSFDWKAGDNVVGDDMEFPSNYYPWKLLEKQGVEYRVAENRGGRVSAGDIAAKVDARTRIVAVSWVAFHNGFVYPLEEIGRFCRERGILLVVDAIQGLGALPLDVAKTPIDVLAADAHKWLLGEEACTVFFVGEAARERLPVAFGGWWNIRGREDAGFLDYGTAFHDGSRRYEPGALPTAQIAGLDAAIGLLQEIGIETVHDRILGLVSRLREGLAARGWRIASPEPLGSGILAAVPPAGTVHAMAKALERRGVIVAPREGAVRFSPHAGNDAGEVARILATIDELGEAGHAALHASP